MVRAENKIYHYHAVVDKDNNTIFKCPSMRYAKQFANRQPIAVAIKEVYHTIKEDIVWRKNKE